MQVTELKSEGLQRNYKVVVEAATLNEHMERELRAAGERVKIPGFRPGYIPMKVLQQRYGKSVQSDVIRQAINHATSDVIAQKKQRPAQMPKINIEDYKEGGDLTFTMAFEAFPEVPDIKYDKITLERKTFEITDADIDETSKTIAERAPAFERLKEGSKAAEGNVVLIDFKGTIDGVAFDGGTASDFRLELGSGQFIAGFEDQLIGAKEGEERDVKVTFPKDYPGDQVAGKDAVFAVTVKEIYSKEPSVIDDAFAKDRGFADLAALRDAIKQQMVREYDQVVRNQLKKQLFDILEEGNDFPLPKSMEDAEFNSIWERVKQAKAQGDESVADKDDKELEKEYRAIAQRRVKLGLMLAEVGNRNKIQISREELNRAVMQQASQFPGQEKKVMEFYRTNPERIDDLRGPILEEKAVDFVLSKVKFNDKKVPLAELAPQDEEEEGSASQKKPAKKASKSEAEPKKADKKKK